VILRNARTWDAGGWARRDVVVEDDHVSDAPSGPALEIDLEGRTLLPALVNAHDHLDASTFPALGTPPYANAYEWTADVERRAGDPDVQDAVAVALADRLFLGGARNLLAGVASVAHHGTFHRSLGRPDFPVRVQVRYDFAHSPGLTPELRRAYRTTDRRIPWFVHAAEGTDARSRDELAALEAANVLRQNTVIIHAVAFGLEEARRIAEARACVVWCPEANRRLYGATADVALLRRAGVRVGLGSDGPAAGVRDALTNLAAARREAVLDDRELLDMATTGSGEVARLPAGGVAPGSPADLVAVDDLESLLSGDRRAVALVLVGGRARFGDAPLLSALGARTVPLTVDGRAKAIEAGTGRRLFNLLRSHPAARRTSWARDLREV
jgi:cytosine/adenosine deaminase-related metal-dependent hydrolase